MILKLDGYQYTTELYLNVGYHYIRLTEDSSNLCNINILWLKFHYKSLTIVISNSTDIFQQKIIDLF